MKAISKGNKYIIFVTAMLVAVLVIGWLQFGRNVQKEPLSLGRWDGNTYTNAFVDVKFVLPEGWTCASDEQIAEMMGLNAERLNDEGKHLQDVSKLTSIYDMVATDAASGDTIQIMMEKLYEEVTMERYIEAVSDNLTKMTDEYVIRIGDTGTQTIAGKEYATLMTSIDGRDITQQYFFRQEGNYMISFLFTNRNASEGSMENMLGYFSAPESLAT